MDSSAYWVNWKMKANLEWTRILFFFFFSPGQFVNDAYCFKYQSKSLIEKVSKSNVSVFTKESLINPDSVLIFKSMKIIAFPPKFFFMWI